MFCGNPWLWETCAHRATFVWLPKCGDLLWFRCRRAWLVSECFVVLFVFLVLICSDYESVCVCTHTFWSLEQTGINFICVLLFFSRCVHFLRCRIGSPYFLAFIYEAVTLRYMKTITYEDHTDNNHIINTHLSHTHVNAPMTHLSKSKTVSFRPCWIVLS